MIIPQIIHEEPRREAMELKVKGRGRHQGVDHNLSGVRVGGKGEEERQSHLTNVTGIDRKSPITYSADKYACVCFF